MRLNQTPAVPRANAALLLFTLCMLPAASRAQDPAASPAEALVALQAAADMVWLITAGALVFFMQAGFALLESGMSRAKNAINVIMKNFCDMCFGAVAFWAVGFGLMFGTNASGWLGTSHFLVHNVTPSAYGMLFFQMMFAATAATIVSGAVAERMRFSGYIVGSVLITGFIYPVFGAWAWGSLYGGEGWLKQLGFIDFAGSTVVHSVGGWCALAAALVVGPRLGRFGAQGQVRPILGHNLTSVALGGFILWLGWFGFNGGSTTAATVGIGKIVLNTHLAGAGGAIGALCCMALMRRPVLMTNAVNGSIAGLVGITAGCSVMEPAYALLTGFAAGIISLWAAGWLERRGVDDVVGAVSIHGFAGVWGTLAAGLFNSAAMFSLSQLGVQALGCAVAFVWAFSSALLMYAVLARTMGLRADTLAEQRGLDFTEHHEVGYPEFQRELVNRGTATA